jgi:hypothetical protein
MKTSKKEKVTISPKFFATIDVHYNLYVPLPGATDLVSALEVAKTINSTDLWNGTTQVEDVFDENLILSGISGPSVTQVQE